MMMDENEIRMYYKYAAKPKEQIKILAQLNDCPLSEIEKILGLRSSGVRRGVHEIRALYDEGYNDREIADAIAPLVSADVYRWRKARGLPANYPSKKKRIVL